MSYPRGMGKADALADMRERLAMPYDGAARLSIGTDGGLTLIELAYPVSRHDD